MTDSTKALFFLRHYNDIDHIVPVIYKWASLESGPAEVVVTTDRDRLDDHRIQLLRPFSDVTIRHLDDFLHSDDRADTAPEEERGPSVKGAFVNAVRTCYHAWRRVLPKPPRFIFRAWDHLFTEPVAPGHVMAEDVYSDAFVESMLDDVFGRAGKGVVAFDWIHYTMDDYLAFATRVVDAAKRRGLGAVCLPHGDSPHANQMLRVNELSYGSADLYAPVSMFDLLVVPNELCAKRYRPHLPRERIAVPGSPRYNDEWLHVLGEITPTYEDQRTDGKLKIAFFLRNFAYPIFWEEVIRTIKLLTQFPDVHLVVKHHTRDVALDELLAAHPEMTGEGVPNLTMAYEEVHSGALLQWADVILDLGTSVAFEAVKLDKPVLAMEYLHATKSTIADYLPCTVMWCRDDLYDTIKASLEDPDRPFYDEGEKRRFIDDMVDVTGPEVLSRYVQLLREHAAEVSAEATI